MKVFGLGLSELLIILAVVLLIFGPKNLPKLGAMLGRTVRKIRSRTDKELENVEDDGGAPASKTRSDEGSAQTGKSPAAKPKKTIVVKKVVRKAVPVDDESIPKEGGSSDKEHDQQEVCSSGDRYETA